MKLIKELTEDLNYITEESDSGEKQFYVEGIIMQGDIKNRNGRCYPSNVLVKEMTRYNRECVDKRRAYGELGHPKGPTINLDRVSHMFTELRQDNSNIIGKAKIMETPMGNIVKSLIKEGACLGISSRGLGSLKEGKNGIMEVQDDFTLATAGDIVADPSAPDAFLNGIMENADWIYDEVNGTWRVDQQNQFDQIHEEIIEISKEDIQLLESKAVEFFDRFLNILSKK